MFNVCSVKQELSNTINEGKKKLFEVDSDDGVCVWGGVDA